MSVRIELRGHLDCDGEDCRNTTTASIFVKGGGDEEPLLIQNIVPDRDNWYHFAGGEWFCQFCSIDQNRGSK